MLITIVVQHLPRGIDLNKASPAEGTSVPDPELALCNNELTCTSSLSVSSWNGSNSWCSSGNETRDSSSERKPTFIKHLLIVDSDTFSQAWALYLMDWSKSTDLDTSVVELQSSILLTTCGSISLMYFSLNVCINPRSRGWSLDNNLVKIKTHNPDVIVFAFHIWKMAGAFLRSQINFWLSLDSASSRMLKSIQALG